MSTLFEILENFRAELPGCRLSSVVEAETGLSLASVSAAEPLDVAAADAFHSDLFRATQAALEGFDVDEALEGFVVTGKETIFVSMPIDDTGYFWHVATERPTTVGFTQAMMRKYASRVRESLSALFE